VSSTKKSVKELKELISVQEEKNATKHAIYMCHLYFNKLTQKQMKYSANFFVIDVFTEQG
jgi:hypothetical protein